MKSRLGMASIVVLLLTVTAHAQIYRWDNGQIIPGTEGITPGPGVQLDHWELGFADLSGHNLARANFSASNLMHAQITSAILTGVILDGAVVTWAGLGNTTSHGFTREQLYSTDSYQQKNLQGIQLWGNDLSGWNFRSQDLSYSYLGSGVLSGADLSGAVVTGANFYASTSGGFTKEQLYSTESFQQKNLSEMNFSHNDLSRWDLAGRNLTNASFLDTLMRNSNLSGSNLRNADLRGDLTNADLSGAILSEALLTTSAESLGGAILTGARLDEAVIDHARFDYATYRGFTKEQLYSTASYRDKKLQGIWLLGNDLSDWDFSGQDLTEARFKWIFPGNGANLTRVNFAGADLRGATLSPLGTEINFMNTIMENGRIEGLHLASGESLWIRDYDGYIGSNETAKITVFDGMFVLEGRELRVIFESDPWDSLIAFEPCPHHIILTALRMLKSGLMILLGQDKAVGSQ